MAINDQAVLQKILDQIDEALEKWRQLDATKVPGYTRSYYYKIEGDLEQEVITTLASTIYRITPTLSIYREDVTTILGHYRLTEGDNPTVIDRLAGVLQALRSDYESGFLRSVQELIHGDIFADFLEMADYFLEQTYKDPAAVIAGGVLEEHLRKLCQKNGIPTDDMTPTGIRPKKADRLNADLASQNVYSKLDQKSVTAWLDLRNKAAHGKYTEYTEQQVTLMVQGIRDFITRQPA